MAADRPTVSVVIPTLNAGRWLRGLLAALDRQQPAPPDEVVLVDSGSADDTLAIASANPRVRVVRITSFTHGGARNLGIREARGVVVALMTQDAEPADADWLARLIAPLEDPSIAAAYSRQIPRDDASPMERFFLADRFPAGERSVRQFRGAGVPVYPDTFFSNVSSAARRETWMRFPFDETLIMSEDQQFVRDVLVARLAIAYEPASVVLHSHTYNLRQTFKRYFDSVVAFRQLEAGHGASASAKHGRRTLGRELGYIARTSPWTLPYFALYMVFKAAGVLAGHAAPKLPRSWCRAFSMNPRWWDRA